MKRMRSEKIKKVRSGAATIHLGKKGVTEEFILELEKLLSREKIVKVRVLKSVLAVQSMDEVASEILERTKSQLLETRGYTLLLAKYV